MAKSVYDELNDVYADAHFASIDYRQGKNKKIREQAGGVLKHAIHKAEYIINTHEAVAELFNKDYGHIYVADEFFSEKYLARDLADFLKKYEQELRAIPA